MRPRSTGCSPCTRPRRCRPASSRGSCARFPGSHRRPPPLLPPQDRAACSARHAPVMASPLHLVSRHPRESLRPDFRAMDPPRRPPPQRTPEPDDPPPPEAGCNRCGADRSRAGGPWPLHAGHKHHVRPGSAHRHRAKRASGPHPGSKPGYHRRPDRQRRTSPAGQNAMQSAIQGAGPGTALASRAQAVARPTLAPPAAVQAPALDDDDPNPSLTPVEPDTHMLAAADPGPRLPAFGGGQWRDEPDTGRIAWRDGPVRAARLWFWRRHRRRTAKHAGWRPQRKGRQRNGGMGSGGPGGAGGPPPLPESPTQKSGGGGLARDFGSPQGG
jgi:hypothetical protein